MSKKTEFSQKEIKRREQKFTASLDAKTLRKLRDSQPEIVLRIEELLEVGHSVSDIGYVARRENPQMWAESKYAESLARALIAEAEAE
jgi:hypothetical protein